jgi:Tannase-like family of unknown function (DUF6351)
VSGVFPIEGWRRALRVSAALCVWTTFLAGVAMPAAADDDDDDFKIQTLSTRPDAVTGGDVLVQIEVPRKISLAKVRVTLNGRDITKTLRPDAHADTLTGLVTGLALGENEIAVDKTDSRDPRGRYDDDWDHGRHGHRHPAATLRVTNYPITGPVFSGPHEKPFFCETTAFAFPDGTRPLGAPLDADCSIKTRVDYFYRSTANAWKPLAPPYAHPTDLATTTTNEGKTVPFIIRLETGSLNRAIYQTSMLHDPLKEPAPDLFRKSSAWNGRLVYSFGGGCTNGWYRQGASTGGVTDTVILGKGYAMASSSLNVFGNNCNDLLTSESLMMTRERFIETYGVPRYTIGFGCSGGSYQQHQAADAYPGLLDGIIPGCSFPEVGFATIQAITDARLLVHYFDDTAPGSFTQEQQRRVAGFLKYETMRTNTVYVGALRIAAPPLSPYCAIVPLDQRYDPKSNPGGARCNVYDHTINVYGRDPATGFALRPLDNLGIQYGLGALKDGAISVDQFLDLNEKIGGYDHDGNFRSQRSVGDLPAIQAAYRSGRLTNAGLGLRRVPIIDYRAYADGNADGDIHLRYHSFSMRERLKKANGDANNQIMLVEDFRFGYYSSASPLLQFALDKMDQWIANIQADRRHGSRHEKVVRNKPAELREGCNTRDATPTFIAEKQTRDPNLACEKLYPSPPAPREVAGASVASDVIKCQLKAVNRSDYPTLTDAQFQRLQKVFPSGVCDWSKDGVGQDTRARTWVFF